jgi:2,3-bisphosphoglycerate-independent phosphoglycerate mutase
MSNMPDPVALIVLDGWGYRAEREHNAIEMARTPVWHGIWNGAPRTLLDASGLPVGLPDGQMGNSEVGHLNIGAGRVVMQDLVRISESIRTGDFFRLPPFVELGHHLKATGGTLHLLGLIGSGGVHAIDTHLLACLELAMRLGARRVAVHGFLDGRDTLPASALEFVERLRSDVARIAGPRGAIASLVGRYFAMDRDRRWDRTRLAYDLLVRGAGTPATDPVAAIRAAYARGETDEFILPIALQRDGAPVATLEEGDAVICFNYRSDRMRQLVRALFVDGFDGFDVPDRPAIRGVTMTQYDATFPLPQAFPPFNLARILAEVLADTGLAQFRTAETEKYPHVTYFFNAGREPPYAGEERQLVPSPRVATYDLQPEMSAAGVTDTLCAALRRRDHALFLCNFANADMVGHTGVPSAILQAVETVDHCLGRVLEAADATGTRVLVTADHGNCEMMVDPGTGGPHTAHTTNPVPFVAVGSRMGALRPGGALCDVAPTILELLGLDAPAEMTGRSLAS